MAENIFEKTIVISTKDVTAYKNKIPFDVVIEELYQAFKLRLIQEVEVQDQTVFGFQPHKLIDKIEDN